MTSIQIVVVSFQDQQQAIRSVRHAVFIEEQGIDPVLEWDEQDLEAVFALAFDGTACVGTARLLPTGKIGRMAVLASWRLRGIGSDLLDTLLSEARHMGMKKVTLSSQLQVCEFYQRFGFIPVGQPYSQAGITHQDMYRHL